MNIRKTHSRSPWLGAVMAVAGLTVSALAQPNSPPPPIDFVVGANEPKATPLAPPPRNQPPINVPAFSGFGKGESKVQPASFPQPDPTPAKVWNVSGSPSEQPSGVPGQVVRQPRDFGQGWKGFVNQNVVARDAQSNAPAATLVAPKSTGPRPEWNWHGYERYANSQSKGVDQTTADNKANSADMAPFMKYAHLWKPSTISAIYGNNNQYLGGTSSPAAPLGPVFVIEPSKPGNPTLTPSVTVPLNDPKPGPIQPTEFRATPITGKETPAPLPPIVTPVPLKPKLVYFPPPSDNSNRLPQPIREKISTVCAGKCRNLIVEMQSPIRLRVSFMVKDQFEADMLINTLAGLQELSPYKVDFEVQIGQ